MVNLLRGQLGQLIRVENILMNKESAPTAPDAIEMTAVKWNTWAYYLHIA